MCFVKHKDETTYLYTHAAEGSHALVVHDSWSQNITENLRQGYQQKDHHDDLLELGFSGVVFIMVVFTPQPH